MLKIIIIFALVWVAWKVLAWGIKAARGIAKISIIVLLLPLFLFAAGFVGLIYLTIPILIIIGICALLRRLAKR